MQDGRLKLISTLNIITGIGLLLFRIALLSIGIAPSNPTRCYYTFTAALIIPESILALLLVLAGIFIVKNRQLGYKLSLVSAGALILIGLLDFFFNIQNDIYASSTVELIINGLMNAWCVGLGLFIVLTKYENN
jgi:hypothetical protein